jgi:hypothetical protein
MGAVEEAVSRLTSQIPARTVYAYAVPDGDLPARYLVVYGSEGAEESTRMSQTVNVATPAVWVTSVSRNADPEVAAREAAWGAQKARAALRNYRPDGGWAFRSETSQPARSNETASVSTFYAVEQFSRRTHL